MEIWQIGRKEIRIDFKESVYKIDELYITSDMRSDLLSLRPLHITSVSHQQNKNHKYGNTTKFS